MALSIRYIKLFFENCDSVIVWKEHVQILFFEKISTSLEYMNEKYTETHACKSAYLLLHKDALDLKTEMTKRGEDGIYSPETLEKHLIEYHDISHIEVTDSENNKIYMTVPWCLKDSFSNEWEKVSFNDKYVTVEISKAKKKENGK